MILPKNWSEERKRATSVWCMAIIFIGLLAFGGYSIYGTIFNPFKISPENARLADQFRAAIAAQQLQADQQRQALIDQFNKSATLPTPTTPEVSVPGLPTPTELRAALKKSGATDAQLAQISDSELMSAYNQTLADQQKSASAGGATSPAAGVGTTMPNTAPTSTTLEQLSQMTPAQIRALLLKNGMSKADLDKMDDKTLQSTFQQVLTEQIATQSTNSNK